MMTLLGAVGLVVVWWVMAFATAAEIIEAKVWSKKMVYILSVAISVMIFAWGYYVDVGNDVVFEWNNNPLVYTGFFYILLPIMCMMLLVVLGSGKRWWLGGLVGAGVALVYIYVNVFGLSPLYNVVALTACTLAGLLISNIKLSN